MPIPGDFQLLEPWIVIRDDRRSELLVGQVRSDLPPSHPFYGAGLKAVAERSDRDDVLFEIEGGQETLAVVHLTWHKETDPRWPSTRLFDSWEQWTQDEMLPANLEYS